MSVVRKLKRFGRHLDKIVAIDPLPPGEAPFLTLRFSTGRRYRVRGEKHVLTRLRDALTCYLDNIYPSQTAWLFNFFFRKDALCLLGDMVKENGRMRVAFHLKGPHLMTLQVNALQEEKFKEEYAAYLKGSEDERTPHKIMFIAVPGGISPLEAVKNISGVYIDQGMPCFDVDIGSDIFVFSPLGNRKDFFRKREALLQLWEDFKASQR